MNAMKQSDAMTRRSGRRFVVIGLVLFLAVSATATQQANNVILVIDYNDGVEKHFTALTWTEGMTVLDAMNQAKEHPHGIRFAYKGTGATAFLTQIDDLENQGGGAGKKNWVYRVNDKLADKSFGVYEIKAGDTVRWKFMERKQ